MFFIILFYGINGRDFVDVLKYVFVLFERIRVKKYIILFVVYLWVSFYKFFGNIYMYIYIWNSF